MNPYEPPSGESYEPPIVAEFAEKPTWLEVFLSVLGTTAILAVIMVIVECLIRIDVLPTNDEIIVWLRRHLLNR